MDFKIEIDGIRKWFSSFSLISSTLYQYKEPCDTGTRDSTSCSILKQFLPVFRLRYHPPYCKYGVNLLSRIAKAGVYNV